MGFFSNERLPLSDFLKPAKAKHVISCYDFNSCILKWLNLLVSAALFLFVFVFFSWHPSGCWLTERRYGYQCGTIMCGVLSAKFPLPLLPNLFLSRTHLTFVLILADVDECVTGTHSCLPSEHCVNTVGSFVCELRVPCPAGYQLRNSVCEGEFIVPDVFH